MPHSSAAPAGYRQELAVELYRADSRVVARLQKHSLPLLRASQGIVFLWFGALKSLPVGAPQKTLATRTIDVLSFRLVPASVSIVVLAAWECAIGLGLLSGRLQRLMQSLLFGQMLGTLTPVFLFPSEVFSRVPFAPTLEVSTSSRTWS